MGKIFLEEISVSFQNKFSMTENITSNHFHEEESEIDIICNQAFNWIILAKV
jgi:hypothetical protein